MSTNSSPPTRRSVLKIAAAGGVLGLITSASSSIVNPARAAGIAADNAARRPIPEHQYGPTGVVHEVQWPRRPRLVELILSFVFVPEAIEA